MVVVGLMCCSSSRWPVCVAQFNGSASGVVYYQELGLVEVNLLLMGPPWGAGAPCGSSALRVQTVTGSILGFLMSYALPAEVDLSTSPTIPYTDNCLSLTFPYLSSGVAFESSISSVFLAQLWYNSPQYDLLFPRGPNPPSSTPYSTNTPPLVLNVTAPSTGLLFNSGFDSVLSLSPAGTATTTTFAPGWTGVYTVAQFPSTANATAAVNGSASTLLPPPPPLANEPSSAQLHYVVLNASLSQSRAAAGAGWCVQHDVVRPVPRVLLSHCHRQRVDVSVQRVAGQCSRSVHEHVQRMGTGEGAAVHGQPH